VETVIVTRQVYTLSACEEHDGHSKEMLSSDREVPLIDPNILNPSEMFAARL
jgi:hypothetical protein